MDKKIKIALIGAGKWGKNLLKELVLQTDVMYVCHNESEETAKFLKETYPSIKSATSLEKVLSDKNVEAAVIATPIPTHKAIALKAIEAGKHIFLEKPGGKNSGELEEICQSAEKKGVILAIGYEFIHHPAWKKICEVIPKSFVQSIHMEWFKWGSFDYNIVINLLCHEISLLQSFGVEVKLKNGSAYKIISDSDIVDVILDCKTFQATSYINCISTEKRKTVTVVGKKETLIWNGNDLFSIEHASQSLVPIEIEKSSPVSIEIKDFLEAVREKREPKASGQFALKIFKIIERVNSL